MIPLDESTAIRELAACLLRQRGLNPPTKIEPLVGGRNNRTFRVAGPGGPWLLKQYFHDATGRRDRCGTEWAWSSFCWQHGLTWGPEPVARDGARHASLFEFIDGRHLRRDEIGNTHVGQAAAFVAEVNCFRNDSAALALPQAAEACFSLAEHNACVDRRIQRLSTLPIEDALDRELMEWLQISLIPAWHSIASQLRGQIDTEQFLVQLPLSCRCLSPSDFGFHNALVTSTGRLRFFDFEYAGWDDPAKLICDFFWQQELPAPRETRPYLIDALSDRQSKHGLEQRVEYLVPVYGVKWCCLVLNEFVAEDRRRREFAQAATLTYHRRSEQLARAKQLLVEVQAKSR